MPEHDLTPAAGSRSKENYTFVRQVPKFLQAHAHLLGKGAGGQGEDDPVVLDDELSRKREGPAVPDADDDAAERQEALAQALAANPSLLLEHPELADVAIKAQADGLKERGNRAFTAGQFESAAALFQQCADVCPGNEVYWSNLSAARASLKDWPAAEAAAQRAVDLAPRWPKAHARLGAAYVGQEDHVRALERYERAVQLEPANAQLQQAVTRARVAAAKQEAEGKHRFKAKPGRAADVGGTPGPKPAVALPGAKPPPTKRKAVVLSFSAEDEEV